MSETASLPSESDETQDQQPDETPPSPPGFYRRHRRLIKILAIVGAVIVALIGAVAGVTAYFAYRYDHNITRISKVFAPVPGEHRPAKVAGRAGKAQNFILVGTDSRAPTQTTGTSGNPSSVSPIGQRSDTIMIVHIPADRKSVYLISIPRDSWVSIPDNGEAKVNAALAWGGPRLLRSTIEQLTGVRIDHYMEVDFFGFKAMTDAVGGVDINVPIDSYDSARHKQWHAGRQHMNGEEALLYVRQRYGLPNGDFDRIKHQHQFLQALVKKVSHTGMLSNPVRINRLLTAITKSISVDSGLGGGDLLKLARELKSSAGNAHYYTVPVTGTGWEGDQSVVFLDAAKDKALWNAIKYDKLDKYVLPPSPYGSG